MKKRLIRIAIIVGLILLIPVYGNFYIEGWNWSGGDFIVMGTLLFLTGFAIDFVTGMFINLTQRVLAIGAVVLAFLFVWASMVHNLGERLLGKIFCGGVC